MEYIEEAASERAVVDTSRKDSIESIVLELTNILETTNQLIFSTGLQKDILMSDCITHY